MCRFLAHLSAFWCFHWYSPGNGRGRCGCAVWTPASWMRALRTCLRVWTSCVADMALDLPHRVFRGLTSFWTDFVCGFLFSHHRKNVVSEIQQVGFRWRLYSSWIQQFTLPYLHHWLSALRITASQPYWGGSKSYVNDCWRCLSPPKMRAAASTVSVLSLASLSSQLCPSFRSSVFIRCTSRRHYLTGDRNHLSGCYFNNNKAVMNQNLLRFYTDAGLEW